MENAIQDTKSPNDNPLAPLQKFSSLSLLDLLKARDLYHLHLTERKGAIATSVGKFFIRKGDSWPGQPCHKTKGPKTLETSEVRDYSWPCIIVFVDKWVDESKMPRDYESTDMLPKVLHMPDGKVVPVCVLEAPRTGSIQTPDRELIFPKEFIGGGYPLLTEVQGQEHIASVGCMVTDGHFTYALTNRHVAGNPGEVIDTMLGGERVPIGISSANQLTRLVFTELYPGCPGDNVYVNLDIGLIEAHDLAQWTPQVYGLGKLGPLADLSVENFSLQLIGARVRAYGAVSGVMEGQIAALFYRYKSVGGFEYVSDFLIGPRHDVKFQTHPGDSGTLWVLELLPDKEGKTQAPRPLALQWGGHVFTDSAGERRQSFALATNLSAVCHRLGLDLVTDWGQNLPEYWGAVGHFTIANIACQIVGKPTSNIRKLMKANLLNITLNLETITDKNVQGMSKLPFVPLADVPDLAWKIGPHSRGPRNNNPESPNHFADLDEPPPDASETLLVLSADPATFTPRFWLDHVSKFPDHDPAEAGLLPFRVWQIYDEMVKFVKASDRDGYICAAGVLAHYIGDACQPLHISFLHHGHPDSTNPKSGDVHSDYEAEMFKNHGEDMKQRVQTTLNSAARLVLVKGGRAAGLATLSLMQQTFAQIPPVTLADFYDDLLDQNLKKSKRLDKLWERFGDDTIAVISNGCLHLAMLWESAFKEGKGDSKITNLTASVQDDLVALYANRKFCESFLLTEIADHLNGLPASARKRIVKKAAAGRR